MLTLRTVPPVLAALAVSWGGVGVLAGHAWWWLLVAAGMLVLAVSGVVAMRWSWPDLDEVTRLGAAARKPVSVAPGSLHDLRS